MSATSAGAPLLRADALAGRRIAATSDGLATLGTYGATVVGLVVDRSDDEAALAAAEALGPVDAVVCDARAEFGAGGYDGLRAALDGAFVAARSVLVTAFRATGRGRVVLIAPPPGAGEHAGPTRAGLENLARTLGTEWARYCVSITAILPADATTDAEVSDLVAFLASDAGGYYTGCALTLG